MKVLMLIGLVVFICDRVSQADEMSLETIHSKVYGTWSPPPELLGFWKGMKDEWWIPGNPNEKMLDDCFSTYVKTHDAKETIPKIFLDLKNDDNELKEIIYSSLILHWNRKEVKIILNHYDAFKGDTAEHGIAEDFIADIEEVEAHKVDSTRQP